MQLNVFFPTNAVYSLKSFISATSNVNFQFFFHCLNSEKRSFTGASCQDDQQPFFQLRCWWFFLLVWFMPEITEQTSDWEWHKTSRSRVHHVKIHLITLHLPTFSMGFSKKCLRSGPLNLQTQEVLAEGKTSCMKSKLFQNSRYHFSQFQIRCNVEDSAKTHSTTIWMCRK